MCQNPDLSAIILTGTTGREKGGKRHDADNTHCKMLLMQVIVFHYKQDDDINNLRCTLANWFLLCIVPVFKEV